MNSTRTNSASILNAGLSPFELKLHRPLLSTLHREFANWRRQCERRRRAETPFAGPSLCRRIIHRIRGTETLENIELAARFREFLAFRIQREMDHVESIEKSMADFQRLYPQAPTEAEQRQLILSFAQDLGASRRQLRQDGLAFGRWFDHDAVIERAIRRSAEAQQRLAFYLTRLGKVASELLAVCDARALTKTWHQLDLEGICTVLQSRRFDDRVGVAAVGCLRESLSTVDPDQANALISAQTARFVRLAATDVRRSTWMQCEALSLLRIISSFDFKSAVHMRLDSPQSGDDIFVRFHMMKLLALASDDMGGLAELTRKAMADPSAYVRQAALSPVMELSPDQAIANLCKAAIEDREPEVRAAALLAGCQPNRRPELRLAYLKIVNESLTVDADPFVLRTAMHVVCKWLDDFITENTNADGPHFAKDDSTIAYIQETLEPSIRRIQATSPIIPVRRYAAEAAERIWLALNPRLRRLAESIKERVGTLPPGRSRRLPSDLLDGFGESTFGRVLAVLAQDDFGFDLEKTWFGYRITRGPRFRFRLWRFLFEMCNPSPDKRQAYRHTVGRVSNAFVRAPSAILSELSETRVPGEPLFRAAEGGWKPYLPLVDDVLSALNQFGIVRPTRFYTSQGITEIVPPRKWYRRLHAYVLITVRFAHFARLRNWTDEGNDSPDSYIDALKKIGVAVSFTSHQIENEKSVVHDESVLRFFPLLLAIGTPTWVIWCQRQLAEYATYFSSIYDNSLEQLVAFGCVFACFFVLRHWISNLMLSRARSRIALAIGGWGTRGKSGTERLKAALLNGMGHSVVSKSTGCEAMFLYASTYGELHEYPLYRPEDKATIWEHRDTIRMAAKLRSTLFIWECMALRSEFVRVLQKQWSRDDLSTITNAIPDHEDVQGPSGIDVAETIATFVPRNAKLLTTEEQMRPILRKAARREKTEVRTAGWLESGLLAPDILERFPYQEHPDNIALTLLVAEELGCNSNFALKEMADRLVPDLGVLHTSPAAQVATRTLEFTNGMSANERHGCMGNWNRLGFDKQDYIAEPTVWVSTVVNNRADRIARSRVFAKILVCDLAADRHFLIGRNLKGLLAYIRESWDEQYVDLRLWSSQGKQASDPLGRLTRLAHRFRQSTEEEHVTKASIHVVQAALSTVENRDVNAEAIGLLWDDTAAMATALRNSGVAEAYIESIVSHLETVVRGFREYRALFDRISRGTKASQIEIESEFRETLWRWFERKLVVVEDHSATGEQIVNVIVQETPPGFRNRIMGLQNIKGTGLDFVYRWQAWHQCHDACQMIMSNDLATAQAGLRQLSTFEQFGVLCDELTRKTIQRAERSSLARREQTRLELDRIRHNLERALTESRAKTSTIKRQRLGGFVAMIEDFLSVSDAVRRRKLADQIYQDLSTERISSNRAIAELRLLNKRQKDGWFADYLDRLFPHDHTRSEQSPRSSLPRIKILDDDDAPSRETPSDGDQQRNSDTCFEMFPSDELSKSNPMQTTR